MTAVRRAVALAALSALAVVAAPTAAAQTPTVTSVIGSADGLFVDLEVDVAINGVADLTFGPEPSVTLPPQGGSVSDEVVKISESAELITVSALVLSVSAEGALGSDGFATAESSVADLALFEDVVDGVGAQQLEEDILAAELITATCSADLDGVSGSTTLVNASVLGTALDAEPEPNTELDVTLADVGSIGVTLNQQVENPDGSLSVTALVLEIEIDTEVFSVTGTLEIGPATCGVFEGLTEPLEEVVPAPAQPVPAAQVRFTG